MNSPNRVYAPFFLRFFSAAVDWVLIIIIFSIARLVVVIFVPSVSLASSSQILMANGIVTAIYNIFFVYKYGGTLGKKFVGIEITKEQGKISLWDAFRREAILKPLSVLLLGLGIVYMFFNPKKQTFYDKRLGLVVIIKSKLQLVKLVVILFCGVLYAFYWVGIIKLTYTLVNTVNEKDKMDLIEEIKQKKKILDTATDDPQLAVTAKKISNTINNNQKEYCLKQLMTILLRKKNCQLEDLDVNSLKSIAKQYTNGIEKIVETQSKLYNK